MSVAHIDQSALDNLRDIMEDDFSSLLSMFLQDTQQNIDLIVNALSDKNTEGMQVAAHTIKGSSANIGVAQLSSLCADLESQIKMGVGDLEVYAQLVSKIKAEFQLVKSSLATQIS